MLSHLTAANGPSAGHPEKNGAWSIAAPQRTPVHGGSDFPSVRYSACAVQHKGEMIVTHGYFYNHAVRHPAWQSNAWAFNFASRQWRKVHEGERAGAPSARYSASAVSHVEVFALDRATMLNIGSQFDHASKRLRRYVLMQSLRSYLLANLYSVRSGAGALNVGTRSCFTRRCALPSEPLALALTLTLTLTLRRPPRGTPPP